MSLVLNMLSGLEKQGEYVTQIQRKRDLKFVIT